MLTIRRFLGSILLDQKKSYWRKKKKKKKIEIHSHMNKKENDYQNVN